MTPEEIELLRKLSEDNNIIRKMLQKIESEFERFTTEKKQHWKDEQARRRERAW